MDLISLLQYSFSKVVETFSHNWFLLLLSILISAALSVYVDQDAIARFLRRNTKNSVLMATGVAVATPFCSCGTTAVILGMMASTIPWAPIVAFMVASPLTSPQELFYSAGLFGWPFAIAFFAASILLGLMGGVFTGFAESRGWLKDQARVAAPKPSTLSFGIAGAPMAARAKPVLATSSCCGPDAVALPASLNLAAATPAGAASCACSSSALELPLMPGSSVASAKPLLTLPVFVSELWSISKRLLPLFFGFTFVGYFLNGLIPVTWVTSLFGAGHAYSIPLAATLGLPFYINTEASLPLVRAMLEGGMSEGAALAFLITGAGTSIGAVGGALTIARWRVLAIVIGTLWAGSILIGLAYNLFIL
jgi:uncharacterized membrane protein YraQ (UPF0718 family)